MMRMTTTRPRRALTRLAGATVGLLAGLALAGIEVLALVSTVTRYPLLSIPALMVAVALPVTGLLLGLHRANTRLKHPRPERRLNPGDYPNRIVRHR
jgi:TRAP-type C4-dicarboxylate transport system permease small subunit